MKYLFVSTLFALCAMKTLSAASSAAINEVGEIEEEYVNKEVCENKEECDEEEEYEEEYEEEEEYELDYNYLITSGKFSDFYDYFGCDGMFDQPRQPPTKATWEKIRSTYKSLTTPKNNTLPDHDGCGILIDYEVKNSPGKGRGVYATKDIKKGTKVFKSTQTARFDDGAAYREFLLQFDDDHDIACDILEWSYVENVGKDNYHDEDAKDVKVLISVDMDDSSLTNHGVEDKNFAENPAIAETFLDRFSMYATRDIKAGEELLCDYDEWSLAEEWETFGM